MKRIIAISGKQYSGKDTLAKILLEKLKDYKRIGIGDAIKIEYGKKKNLSFNQIEKDKHLYRSDLIALGNWGRNQDNNYWLKNLMGFDKIIVPDVRVLHEIQFFKSQGAFLVRVESDLENRSLRGKVVDNNDPTETALDNYTGWNIVLFNNSSYDDLVLEADKLIEQYLKFIS